MEEFAGTFDEEPGYLDFARVGPLARVAVEEERASVELLSRARFGSLDSLMDQDDRVRAAVAAVSGVPADRIVFQPNTSMGLLHAVFGLSGSVLLSPAEFPSSPFAAERDPPALGAVAPVWLETDYGRVTPGTIRNQLTKDITAVVVSLVDFRTGYLADLEGIRQVIGDRLLIVDAIQGFGVSDAPLALADVVASGGQKWVRAGWDTGFLAFSERAIERLTPVLSGFNATDEGDMPLDRVPPPSRSARAFQVSNPNPIAQARFAAALEQLAEVGIPAVAARVREQAQRIVELADEFAIPVTSSRDDGERAGIVVLEPAPDQLTVLAASLHNHGVTVTVREPSVRVSVHVTTTEETFGMLRTGFQSFVSATTV
jgi:selenocysteine lyase/cysteine desulfurase